jgi:predicted RecB family nuclease
MPDQELNQQSSEASTKVRKIPDTTKKRRDDDRLSLIAGISSLQRKQLRTWDCVIVATLAKLPVPIPHRPDHGLREGYVHVREHARLSARHGVEEVWGFLFSSALP